ncbi:MAG TPA: hypothetical protein DDW51_16110 [Cyanobacteria bacterium UBA11367]|nr:hypothetical protein [Cyanobacteria bacterium UBA11367]
MAQLSPFIFFSEDEDNVMENAHLTKRNLNLTRAFFFIHCAAEYREEDAAVLETIAELIRAVRDTR